MLTGQHLKIPERGDRGTQTHPAISENFTKLDTHAHNGINSEKIESKYLTKGSETLLSANWVADNEEFKQTITMPSGWDFDTVNLDFIVSSGVDIGKRINPSVKKLSVNSFDVFISFNNIDLKVIYS